MRTPVRPLHRPPDLRPIGSLLFRLLGLQGIGDIWLIGNILVGVVGAVILIYAVRLFSSNKAFGK